MNKIKDLLEKINQSSESLKKLREINEMIGERKFHEHTHILYDIRTFLGEKDVNFVEIGSYVGSSACLMLGHPYNTSVTCIDPLSLEASHYIGDKDQEATLRDNLNSMNPYERTYTIHKNLSWNTEVINSISNIDILHIDGDHSYNAVIKDYTLYKDKVNTGGFIVFDDYHDHKSSPEVKLAVDKIISEIDSKEYEVIGSLNKFHEIKSQHSFVYSNFILQKIS
jgi:predicted O-methyltransferase YrrM